MTEKAEVDAGIEKIEREIGPIDILINNAGMQYRTQLEDFPPTSSSFCSRRM